MARKSYKPEEVVAKLRVGDMESDLAKSVAKPNINRLQILWRTLRYSELE